MRRINNFSNFAGKISTNNLVTGSIIAAAGVVVSIGIKKIVDHVAQNCATSGSFRCKDTDNDFSTYSMHPEEGSVNFIFGTGDQTIADDERKRKQWQMDEILFPERRSVSDEFGTVANSLNVEEHGR